VLAAGRLFAREGGSVKASIVVPPAARASGLSARLGVMFALETASIATYVPLLSLHLREGLGFTPLQTSLVFAVGPVTSLIGPAIAGLLADRALRAERALSFLSVVRAVALVVCAQATSFDTLFFAALVNGFCQGQAWVLTSTIAFHHLPDARKFGITRVWGTASWVLMIWLVMAFVGQSATRSEQLHALHRCFYAGAGVALCQMFYALTLPATAPPAVRVRLGEAIRALSSFGSSKFMALLAVALLFGCLSQLNLMLQGLFFSDPTGLGMSPAAAGRATTVSQLLELALFPVLGLFLDRLGIRRVILIGILAWPLRYAAYYLGGPAWLVVGAQLLHGLNYVFGFAGLQIAVELLAPPGQRGSAQAAFLTSSSGFGNLIGQFSCGLLLESAALPGGGYDFKVVFLVPFLVGCFASALAYFAVQDAHAPRVAAPSG
jgi:MFS family permease